MYIPHSRPTINEDDVQAVADVVRSGRLTTGEERFQFEEEFAAYVGARGAVAVSSGTAAIHLAMMALDIGNGGEVLVPSYLCDSVLQAVSYVDAEPRLLDVGWNSNLEPDAALDNISDKTKGTIVPHMFGRPIDCRPLVGHTAVIEDCALALGARFNGDHVGRMGDVGIFSFYATKLMTTGVGGMIVSDSKEILDRLEDFRNHADRDEYAVRYHYDMTDFAAALGRSQLRRYDQFLERRRELVGHYLDAFQDCDVILPEIQDGTEPAWYRFVFRAPGRGRQIRCKARERGVMLDAPVFRGLHQCLDRPGFPVTDALLQDNVSVPLYPSLTREEVQYVIETVQRAIAN